MERRDENDRGRYPTRQGRGYDGRRQAQSRRAPRGRHDYDYGYDDGYDDDAYAVIGGGGRRPQQGTQRYAPQQGQRRPSQQGMARQQERPHQIPAGQGMAPSTPLIHAQGNTRVPMTGGVNPYSTKSGLPDAPKRRSALRPVLIALLVLLLVAGAGFGFFLLRKPQVSVTVNGQEVKVDKNSTLDDVKSKLEIEPKPGRLLAIDGSVIDERGGTEQTVTVNGEELSGADYSKFQFTANGATVEFGDGKDETETFTSTEEKEPFETFDTKDMTLSDYWTGSIHLFQHGQEGIKTTKRGDVSGIEVTEDTQQRQDERFVIYTAKPPAGEKVVALTFDDGPWEDSTEAILDVLEENGAKATFFTVGQQVAEHADQVKRARDLGCQVLTHTWDHAAGSGQGVNLTYMSSEEQVEEVEKGYGALRDLFGEEPTHVFRAPGGNFYGSIVDTLKPYVDAEIGWDVDTEDWKKPGSDTIYERIMTVEPGQVVLMHDGGGDRSQTVAAVKRAVPELISRGYRLVTVDELLAYGVPDNAGATESAGDAGGV